jgi:hypothetical protein
MERTKILFGNDNRFDSNSILSNNPLGRQTKKGSNESNSKQILDILKSNSSHINRSDLINALKSSSRAEINIALSNLLSQDLNQSGSGDGSAINTTSSSSMSSLTVTNVAQQNNKLNTQLSTTSSDAVNFDETNSDSNNNNNSSSNMKNETTYSEVNISSGTLQASIFFCLFLFLKV